MTNIKIFVSVIIILVLGIAATAVLRRNQAPAGPGKYDAFAQCINNSGAKFYGAFWCPHCKAQKEMFGSSVKYLPYEECSTPDGSHQTQICIDKKVSSYPTWEFADGSRLSGEIALSQLAEKTGCQLPVGDGSTAPAGSDSPAKQ